MEIETLKNRFMEVIFNHLKKANTNLGDFADDCVSIALEYGIEYLESSKDFPQDMIADLQEKLDEILKSKHE